METMLRLHVPRQAEVRGRHGKEERFHKIVILREKSTKCSFTLDTRIRALRECCTEFGRLRQAAFLVSIFNAMLYIERPAVVLCILNVMLPAVPVHAREYD